MLGGVERSSRGQQLRSYPPLVWATSSKSMLMSLGLPDEVRQEVVEQVNSLSEELRILHIVRDATRIEKAVQECDDELRRLLKRDVVERCENSFEMASFYSLGPRDYLRRSEVEPQEIQEFTENLAALGGQIEQAMLSMEDHAYAAILNEISTRQLKEGFKPVTMVFAHGWRSPNVSVIASSLEDFKKKPFEEVELPIHTQIFRLGALGDAVPIGKRIRDPFSECVHILAASGIIRKPGYERFAQD